MDNGGKILHQEMGTSQQGSCSRARRSFVSSLSESSTSGTRPPVRKSVSMPSTSTAPTSQHTETAKNCRHLHDFPPKFFQRSAVLEAKGNNSNFTLEELNTATENFCPNMLIGEDAKSRIYQGVLGYGQKVAVKVLKISQYAEEFFFQEVEILNSLKHENIVRIVGYCYCREMYAIVYNLLSSSLKQRLNQLKWSERMQIALGVAKALEYLHSSYPPIIHTDVNSSNILLSEDGKPQLSDFGSAKVHFSTHQSSMHKRPVHVIETFGYLAPEYIMYGKVDEKVDVYSFGTLLLEMITGKETIRPSSTSNQESLALRARSLLTCGLDERLIDRSLTEDYNKDEVKAMMIVARLCLLHSSSRRPTMKTILHFLEEPNYVLEIQKKSGDLHSQIEPGLKIDFSRHAKSDSSDI
ncbi:hypothetical protein ACS0TY_004120 [Phlomoides rotata]